MSPRRNRESRIETQQSRIESRFSRGLRIECQFTFERYCMGIMTSCTNQEFVVTRFGFLQDKNLGKFVHTITLSELILLV